jgi:hypothetical protein
MREMEEMRTMNNVEEPCEPVVVEKIEPLEERTLFNKRGMEMVQVAILVAIAVTLGLIFKEQITNFVNTTFGSLSNAKF